MLPAQVLLIDDDAEQTEMLGAFLDREGFQTTSVASGVEGIAQCLSGNFAAAVLDIMLPDVDGIEVLREVRRTSDLPIIMLTAKGDNIDRTLGLELGADDYLPKPYYPRELLARIRAVLRRQSGPRQAEPPFAREIRCLVLDESIRRADWKGASLDLTPTEFNLLQALIQADCRVAKKEDLSLKILLRHWQPFDRSLDVHASHLRRKLKAGTEDVLALETIRGIGYRLLDRSVQAT